MKNIVNETLIILIILQQVFATAYCANIDEECYIKSKNAISLLGELTTSNNDKTKIIDEYRYYFLDEKCDLIRWYIVKVYIIDNKFKVNIFSNRTGKVQEYSCGQYQSRYVVSQICSIELHSLSLLQDNSKGYGLNVSTGLMYLLAQRINNTSSHDVFRIIETSQPAKQTLDMLENICERSSLN